jgi:RNA 3'-phosphate cyclase
MVEIDGSHGEGGGQLLRNAVALSAISGIPIRVRNIRARRKNPGLAPQHLTAVKAVGALCGAAVDGLAAKSIEIEFRPGQVRGGSYVFDIGTAGSVAMVLQALLPVAISSGQGFSFRIRGGTDVTAAPPVDYLRHVLLPLLERMGASIRMTIARRGYYPRGGGEVLVEVQACPRLDPLALATPGKLCAVRGYAHVANLPEHIVTRMAGAARSRLHLLSNVHIAQEVLGRDAAIGMGGAIVLTACLEHTILGTSALAARGVPAERLGEEAADELIRLLHCGATLDDHAADQLLVYMALARRPSVFSVSRLSPHAETALWLIGQFVPVSARVTPIDSQVRVELSPGQR